jgi:TolA-binding protein
MTNKLSLMILAAIVAVTAGCFKTRAELRGDGDGEAPVEKPTAGRKQEPAKPEVKAPPAGFRFEEYDEQLRQLNGRIDSLEAKQNNSGEQESEKKDKAALNQRLQAYEEEFKRVEQQQQLLSEQMTALRAQMTAPTPTPTPVVKGGSNAKSTPYEDAEALYKEKKWKEAISDYEKYRGTYPKGKNFLDATYKIGLCFNELGMKEEARAFYEEVVAKAPKSKEAKKAAFRLKNVK